MNLTVHDSQADFVADNKQSLAEAAYEDGLHPLGIYHEGVMVGFVLYDYDPDIPGWSMSRFMIGKQFQGRGYGKQAVLAFLSYFKAREDAHQLYVSVSLSNTAARKLFSFLGFTEVKAVEYTAFGRRFQEMRMVKELQAPDCSRHLVGTRV